MFQVGQQIIYGGNGVCRIEEIVHRENAMAEEPGEMQEVYVIRLASGLTSFVPIGSSVFMRALISPEKAEEVLDSYESVPIRTFPATNSKALSDMYRSVLSVHQPGDLLCLYKSLRDKIDRAVRIGKRPGSMDERFANAALQEVVCELSIVLHLPEQTVRDRLGV